MHSLTRRTFLTRSLLLLVVFLFTGVFASAHAQSRPWHASISPQPSPCGGAGTFNFQVTQQSNGNGLGWLYSFTTTNYFLNTLNWSVQDSAGTLVSGNYNSGSATSGSGSSVANRAPVGTPTLYVNGSLIGQYSGCYGTFSGSAQATQ